MWWLNTCTYCKIFTTIRLVNTFFTAHNHHLIAVKVRTLKQYSPSNFQVYRTVSLTSITMLCIRSLEIIHLVSASLCPWTHVSPCPPPYNHWEPPLCSLFPWFNVFTFHLWVTSYIFVFAWLISHCIIPSRPIHVVTEPIVFFRELSWCFGNSATVNS